MIEIAETAFGNVTGGTDLRYLKQQLNEDIVVGGFGQVGGRISPSHWSNPGFFLESRNDLSERVSVTGGGRLDWVSTNTDSLGGLPDSVLDQHFDLWSAFLVGDYQVTEAVALTLAGGHSMRAPTLTELYANGVFIAALPQFRGTSIQGNPILNQERMWQADVGISIDQPNWRIGLNGFYSWIHDFVTYDLLGGPLYGYVNTDRATLSGFDMTADLVLTNSLRAIGSLSYVEGRDLTRNGSIYPRFNQSRTRSNSTTEKEPLPVMAPLIGQFGIVLDEPGDNPFWSVEFLLTVADRQDRVASSLGEEQTPGYATFDIRGFAQLTDKLIVTAGALNLTDQNYQTYFDARRTFRSVPDVDEVPVFQPGISFYLGTEWTH